MLSVRSREVALYLIDKTKIVTYLLVNLFGNPFSSQSNKLSIVCPWRGVSRISLA